MRFIIVTMWPDHLPDTDEAKKTILTAPSSKPAKYSPDKWTRDIPLVPLEKKRGRGWSLKYRTFFCLQLQPSYILSHTVTFSLQSPAAVSKKEFQRLQSTGYICCTSLTLHFLNAQQSSVVQETGIISSTVKLQRGNPIVQQITVQ